MKWLQRYARADRGQAIVEVAVLAPFLLILVVSIIDIGRLEHYNMIVGSSARAAVQYGAQGSTFAVDNLGMHAAGMADANNLTGLTVNGTNYCRCSDGSAAICSPPTSCPNGAHLLTYATATASYTFTTLFNYHVIPSSAILSHTEYMQVPQ